MGRATLVIASAVLTLAASVAQAQVATPQNQMAFNGQVAAGCITSNPSASAAQNASATELVTGSANIVVTRLVGDDGVPLGAEIVLSMPSACNQAHNLNLSSLNGGLSNTLGADAQGSAFRALLPYTVIVSWAGQSQTFNSSSGGLIQPVGDAASGPVTVTIQIPSGGAPLVAGSYSDQLVLQLGVAG